MIIISGNNKQEKLGLESGQVSSVLSGSLWRPSGSLSLAAESSPFRLRLQLRMEEASWVARATPTLA